MKIWYSLSSWLFLWLVTSCSGDFADNSWVTEVLPAPYEPPVEMGDSARRTCLVYIVGDNTLSGYVQNDLKEILSAAESVPSDCYMLAYVDDFHSSRILRFFNNDGEGDYEQVYDFEREMASCDTLEMRSVLEWVQLNCPAKKMDLVMWSHATGWLYDDGRRPSLYSFGDDGANAESGIRRMNIEELAALLRGIKQKPERLFFDACFMQGVECAYALRNSVEWVIASPAEIPAEGAPYHKIVPLFFDPLAGIQDILDAYKGYYDGSDTGVVLSAVRCSAMDSFADAVSVVVDAFLSCKMLADYEGLFAYLPGGSWTYYQKFPCFYDINSVMLKYLPYAEYAAFKKALDEAVPYKCASNMWVSGVLPSKSAEIYLSASWCGLSMYLPKSDILFPNNFNEDFALSEWYRAAGWYEAGW